MKVTRDGVDRSTNYTPAEFEAITIRKEATDGEIGLGSIPVPDPAGNQEVYSGQSLLLEDAATTILDGFVGGVDTDRGVSAVGPRRVLSHTLADDNALLHGHRAYRWARGGETDQARWLAFAADFLPGVDTTWVLGTNTIALPAQTYTTDQLFDDLQSEVNGRTGKTAYIENRRFHVHLLSEGQTGDLSIADDGTADRLTIFAPTEGSARRTKDAGDLRNDVFAVNAHGVTVHVTDATSITRHDSAGIKHQSLLQYGDETSAQMTAAANSFLAANKEEKLTYECRIGPLTAVQVAKLIPGCRMSCTSSVWGLSGSTQRLAHVDIRYKHPGLYYADLEFTAPRRAKTSGRRDAPGTATGGLGGGGTAGTGGGGQLGATCPPCVAAVAAPADIIYAGQHRSIVVLQPRTSWLDAGITYGDGQAFRVGLRASSSSIAGSNAARLSFGVNSINLGTGVDNGDGWHARLEWKSTGLWLDTGRPALSNAPVQIVSTDERDVWWWLEIRVSTTFTKVEAKAWRDGDPEPLAYAKSSTAAYLGTAPRTFGIATEAAGTATVSGYYRRVEASGYTPETFHRVEVQKWGVSEFATFPAWREYNLSLGPPGGEIFTDAALSVGPLSSPAVLTGQPVPRTPLAKGDGVTTAFVTPIPYQAGSLEIDVDGVPKPDLETAPATGDFSLPVAPDSTEDVFGRWIAA